MIFFTVKGIPINREECACLREKLSSMKQDKVGRLCGSEVKATTWVFFLSVNGGEKLNYGVIIERYCGGCAGGGGGGGSELNSSPPFFQNNTERANSQVVT